MPEKQELGQMICHLSHLYKRRLDRAVAEESPEGEDDTITGRNGWVICYLMENEKNGHDVFQRDLEKRFGIRRSTVSNMIDLMEKKSLLTRVPTEGDARLRRLVLTDRSRKLYHTFRDCAARTEEQVATCFTGEEYRQLTALLGKLGTILSEKDSPEV